MRNKLLLLLVLFPSWVFGQLHNWSELQDIYMTHVSEFCTLLTRWSNGERTLDIQIYKLCSGSNCTAYDDVTAKKETTLKNYLLGIQRNYPKSFPMEISTPPTKEMTAYYEGEIGLGKRSLFIKMDDDVGYQVWPRSETTRMLAFKVNQKTPLGITTKYILYDFNLKKITGLISGDGSQASYLEGIELLTKSNDYRRAINKFLIAANNKRATYGKEANKIAAVLYTQLGEYDSAVTLAEKSGNKYFASFFKAERSMRQRRYQEAVSYFKECEQIERENNSRLGTAVVLNDSTTMSLENRLPYIHYCIGLSYLLAGNSNNALTYLKQSADEGFVKAAYCIYKYGLQTNKLNITREQAIGWLFYAAKHGLDLAQFEYGVYKEYVEKKRKEAIYWYYTALYYNGDQHPLAKACLGKLCVQMKSGLPVLGNSYLKRALSEKLYNPLDQEIVGFRLYLDHYKSRLSYLTNGQFWIKSESDVTSLITNGSNQNNYKEELHLMRRWYRDYQRDHPDVVLN